EINKGSIFCACVKGDFLKALYRIAFVLKPSVLVIEASGAANPADMKRDLFNPLFKKNFGSLTSVCLLDAENFLAQHGIFTAVEKQVESSDIVILNKIDQADASQRDAIRKAVIILNPHATLVETSYANLDWGGLIPAFSAKSHASSRGLPEETSVMEEDELEEIIDDILQDAAAQVTPPDLLTSATFRWSQGTLRDFQYVADNIPLDVVRAKGLIQDDGRWFLYNHVGRRYEITRMENGRQTDQSVSRVVFVRQQADYDDIRDLFLSRNMAISAA
ncbi:MAG: GTP-binding protein, partial [Pseudomonadota bacterium]